MAQASRLTSATASSTRSRPTATARVTGGPAWASRSYARSSNCTAAPCGSIPPRDVVQRSYVLSRSNRWPRRPRPNSQLSAMLQSAASGASHDVALQNEEATRRLALDVAVALEPGDLVTLSGDLGAGKTAFARAAIRALAADPQIEVPSPTFTLLQTYDLPQFPIVHADLYRVSGSAELAELGFDDLPAGAVVLLEWPDRAAGLLPPNRLDITLTLAPQFGADYRQARITGYGTLASRAERLVAARKFLDDATFGSADRRRMAGDASTRSYERLRAAGSNLILMNSPRRPDGPPVRDGKPYSAIAHLAEDIKPFVAMAKGLRDRGFSAPEVLAADLAGGFAVLEDLG